VLVKNFASLFSRRGTASSRAILIAGEGERER